MSCNIPPVEKLTNQQSLIDVSQLAQSAAAEIAFQLGIALVIGDTIIPLAPFIWAALAIEEIIGLFGGGRPKDEDTNNVIWAYNMSAYWPLHSLATDLAMALRNGAPISDSNPAVQQTFSTWKRGTIESLQQLAGFQPGPASPGYWQLQEFINTSWAYSKSGQQAVLTVVKAMDCFTEALAQLYQYQSHNPPPPPPPPPPPKRQPPWNSEDDEIVACCKQTTLLLTEIADRLGAQNQPPVEGDSKCCKAVVAAIAAVTQQLTIIAQALTFSATSPPAVDLAPIVTALQELVTAVAAYPPAMQACCTAVSTQLGAIASALGPELGANLKPIVDQLATANSLELIPAAFVDAMVKNGSMPLELAQMFSDRPWHWSVTGVLSGIGSFLFGGLSPDLGKQVARYLTEYEKGQTLNYPQINSIVDVLVSLVMGAGYWVSKFGVDLSQAVMPTAKQVLSEIGDAVTSAIPGGLGGVPPGLGAPAAAALNFVKSAPAPGELITVDNYGSIVQDAIGRAGLMGMTAWAAAMVGGFILGPWEKYWGEVAAMIATAAGFEEITTRTIEPFLDAVIANRALQDANRNWPTKVPPGPQAAGMYARRKVSDAELDELFGYFGLDPRWRKAVAANAFHPVSPMILSTAFAERKFPVAQVRDILEDAGYSPPHVQTMLDALQYKSLKTLRDGYVTAAIAAAVKGVVADDELTNILTELEFDPHGITYVQKHIAIQRREAIAAAVETEIIQFVANGVITADQGDQQLEAAGVQPWMRELKLSIADMRAEVMQAKRAAAAERRLELERQRNNTRTAIAEFERGTIDEVGLTAALIALGLDPTLVASIVAVQNATRTGRLKLVYGQLLNPDGARLLVEQVAAIEQQLKDQLITLDQARAQLTQLGIDDADAHALVARWEASLKKSAGASQLVSPWTGLPGE